MGEEVKIREQLMRRQEKSAREMRRKAEAARERHVLVVKEHIANLKAGVGTAKKAAYARAEEEQRKNKLTPKQLAARKVVKKIDFDVGYNDEEMKKDHKKMKAANSRTKQKHSDFLRDIANEIKVASMMKQELSNPLDVETIVPNN